MTKLRALLVGCGRIGAFTAPRLRESLSRNLLPYSHMESMLACPNITVAGACDVNADNLSRMTEVYGLQNTWTDFDSALSECSPDIVSIATRADVRGELLAACISHGVKGLYVEKPFLHSLLESEQFLKAIAASKIKLSYGTNRRYNAGYKYCYDLLRSGHLGKLLKVQTIFPDGLMMWAWPHMVDIALCALDPGDHFVEAYAVSAWPLTALKESIEDDIIFKGGQLKSVQGTQCFFDIGDTRTATFTCENGEIVCAEEGLRVKVRTRKATEIVEPMHIMSPTQRGFYELAEASIEDRPGPISPSDVLHGMEALWMLGQSAILGRNIRRTEIDRAFVFKALYNGLPA